VFVCVDVDFPLDAVGGVGVVGGKPGGGDGCEGVDEIGEA